MGQIPTVLLSTNIFAIQFLWYFPERAELPVLISRQVLSQARFPAVIFEPASYSLSWSLADTFPAGWCPLFSDCFPCSFQKPLTDAIYSKTLESLLIHLPLSYDIVSFSGWYTSQPIVPSSVNYHCVFVCLPPLLNWGNFQRHPIRFCPFSSFQSIEEEMNENIMAVWISNCISR